MPTAKSKTVRAAEQPAGDEYRGKQVRTGNSLGFRFDSALFKSHPEFAGGESPCDRASMGSNKR